MSKPRIILIGAGGHATSCIDVIEQHGQFEIAGLIGMREEMHTRHLGYSVIATDDDLPQLANDYQYAFIAVGQILSPERRIRLYRETVSLGFSFPVIVAPTAHVSCHAVIGEGSIVMHGAIVNASVKIGRNCIVNTRALIEHGSAVDDHCHISTGSILNGGVRIGTGSFVGSGSVIMENVTIGNSCVVGMGLSVRHNQADNARFLGVDML